MKVTVHYSNSEYQLEKSFSDYNEAADFASKVKGQLGEHSSNYNYED